MLKQAEPDGASPAALEKIKSVEPLAEAHILRRKDLVELFDTTPDLAGLDIDVGRYIRDGEERDVQVFWRAISKRTPRQPKKLRRCAGNLSCSASRFQKIRRKNKTGIWYWDVLEGEWQVSRSDRIAPGQIYLINAELGGYSVSLGWTGEKSKELPLLSSDDQPRNVSPRDGQSNDDESQLGRNVWQSIETHTAHVINACREIIASLPSAAPWSEALVAAARWHDVGKAHASFQTFIIRGTNGSRRSQNRVHRQVSLETRQQTRTPLFRHELASALAWLQAGHDDDPVRKSLVAYLIASHHGKVRLSIRSMPGEKAPVPAASIASDDESTTEAPVSGDLLFARGIWHGDPLPFDRTKKLHLDGFPAEPITLDLSCMQMGENAGQPSWTSRILALRDTPQTGIFRLAWLETLLRSADAMGSQR